MDVYILDNNFNKTELIEKYGSVIWTERYSDSGDVTLVVEDTAANRALLDDVEFLGTQESDEVMLLDTVELKDGSIKATGFTLDKMFETRLMVWSDVASEQSLLTAEVYTGRGMNLIVEAFASQAGWTANFGSLVPLDIDMTKQFFTNFVLGAEATPPPGAIPKSYTLTRGPLYDFVKNAGSEGKIGWKFVPINITPGGFDLEFSTYAGVDRSSGQTANPVVRFSPKQDSLTDVSELRSKRDYRTVAYAISPDFDPVDQITGGAEYTGVAYAYPGAAAETDFDRRVMLVEVTGITTDSVEDTQAKYQALLDSKARDALANNNFVKVIDGEIIPQNEYVFGTDYGLGDLIELEDPHGTIQKARITEYIRSSDSNGFRSYPTVSVED